MIHTNGYAIFGMDEISNSEIVLWNGGFGGIEIGVEIKLGFLIYGSYIFKVKS